MYLGMVCHNFRAEVLKGRREGVSSFSFPLIAPERRSEKHALLCVLAFRCLSDSSRTCISDLHLPCGPGHPCACHTAPGIHVLVTRPFTVKRVLLGWDFSVIKLWEKEYIEKDTSQKMLLRVGSLSAT